MHDGTISPTGEVRENQKGMPFCAKEGPNWLTNGDKSCLPPSPTSLQGPPETQTLEISILHIMDAIKDLQFWTTQVQRWNGRPINLQIADLTLTSDAST